MKRTLTVVVAMALAGAALAAELVTPAKTIAPMSIPGTPEGKAMLQGLKPDALQMGLGESVLIGAATYEPQADASTRVTIRWHALGLASGAATQSLRSPLMTQFRTTDKSVAPNTPISVRGDLDLLAEDFLALKARMAKDSPKDTVKQTTNNNTTTEAGRSASDLAQSGSGSAGSGNAPYSFNNNNDTMKADMVTTTWQDCQPRTDKTAGTVYQQARKVEVTESGKVMNTGSCEDHGTTAEIVKTYDGACAPVIDIENRKVYHQFAESAVLNGKTMAISTCTADFLKADPVRTSNEGCGYRHDFTAGRSILQEKLYYNDTTGAVVAVRDCGDSATAYSHVTTTATCAPTIDSVNKQVFINNRVAFTDSNGAEQYATECKPDGNPSFPITEEFCTPKYEHDFTNHVSYYRTRAYYTSSAGSVVYVSECSRSATGSFPHAFQTSDCSATNDDTALMTKWFKKTYIDSPTDGTVEVAPCQELGSPTPYAYVGLTSQAYSAQHGASGGGSCGTSVFGTLRSKLPANFDQTSGTASTFTVVNKTAGGSAISGFTVDTNVVVGWNSAFPNCPPAGYASLSRVRGTLYFPRYLRGDGTYYNGVKATSATLEFAVCNTFSWTNPDFGLYGYCHDSSPSW